MEALDADRRGPRTAISGLAVQDHPDRSAAELRGEILGHIPILLRETRNETKGTSLQVHHHREVSVGGTSAGRVAWTRSASRLGSRGRPNSDTACRTARKVRYLTVCGFKSHFGHMSDLSTPATDLEQLRVLVAEDEPLIRMDIVEILTAEGYQVIGEAENGQRAVDLAREHVPDVVLMDVKMPVLDGISAAEQIAQKKIAPVVLLTAFSQRELVERARDAGAMAYVVKPFSEKDLVPAIELAVARFDELRALEDEVSDLAEQFATRKLVERAKSLLTSTMDMTEPEAFRWIQKSSMNRRLTMREVAQTVIDQMG